uniref:Nucleotide modification associated domain 2 n=1 Tax=Siphoviridae sp. cttG32 TaxID=2825705 RepID=A0A8S5U4X6_9CAUD|nr:MAG TPA: Nucleotide modification associated domain 2 [Siphoviridae sp. cttG32]
MFYRKIIAFDFGFAPNSEFGRIVFNAKWFTTFLTGDSDWHAFRNINGRTTIRANDSFHKNSSSSRNNRQEEYSTAVRHCKTQKR